MFTADYYLVHCRLKNRLVVVDVNQCNSHFGKAFKRYLPIIPCNNRELVNLQRNKECKKVLVVTKERLIMWP